MSPRGPVRRSRARGFSLVEVLISLIVIAVGLLGVAKMQMLALSETSVASKRSIAAIEAASLASSMHANRAYWASDFAPASFTVAGTEVSDATLGQAVGCDNGATCSASQLAAYDVQQWGAAVAAVLPNPVSTVGCSSTPGLPVSCTISISWSETQASVNSQGASGPAMAGPTYTLYVEP